MPIDLNLLTDGFNKIRSQSDKVAEDVTKFIVAKMNMVSSAKDECIGWSLGTDITPFATMNRAAVNTTRFVVDPQFRNIDSVRGGRRFV